MRPYDAPAADPGSVSALAATLGRHAVLLQSSLDDLRCACGHGGLGALDELEDVLQAATRLAATAQTHATSLAETRRPATRAEADLHAALRRADDEATVTALRRIRATLATGAAGPVSPPPPA